MPQPTQSDGHVDAVLTNISVAYIQQQSRFISRQVFAPVPVEKQTDKYYVYTKHDWFRDEAQHRPDATQSAGSGYNLGTDSYSADVWAFHKDVGDQTRANFDNPLNPDADATRFVTQRLLLRQEIQWVSDYFTTGKWATDKTGGTDFTRWSDYAGSDPIEDIEAGKEAILSVTGYMPNTLVLGYQVFRKLKHHPDIIDRYKYTTADNITPEILARLFEVDRVFVSMAVKATNNEGETAAYSFTHGKSALLTYASPTPSLLEPSGGYQFVWTGVSDGLGTEIAISTIRMPLERADRIEGQVAWDNKLVAADLGYFWSGCVA